MAKEPRHNFLLRRIRLQHGLTQSQFAEIAGVQPKTVQRWERGQSSPRSYSVQRLCLHFNTTPADLGVLDAFGQGEERKESHKPVSPQAQGTVSPEHFLFCCILLALFVCLLLIGALALAGAWGVPCSPLITLRPIKD
jgi:transcriptional regulator with XRE-family HTH domain